MDNKAALKNEAQRLLMLHGQDAFSYITEDDSLIRNGLYKELDKQFARMEKLFGYEVGSWARNI